MKTTKANPPKMKVVLCTVCIWLSWDSLGIYLRWYTRGQIRWSVELSGLKQYETMKQFVLYPALYASAML